MPLLEIGTVDRNTGQIVLVRVEGEFVGERDCVLVVYVDGQRGRRNRNAGGRRNVPLPAIFAVTPLASSTLVGCMVSSQPLELSTAFWTEPPPVTVVLPFAVSVLMEVLPVVRMVPVCSLATSQTSCIQRQADAAAVHFKIEKPPAVAARLLSVSVAEVFTSVVPILVLPVAMTCGVSPVGLETTISSAETPSSVTLPPLTMISPATVTSSSVTLPARTPSVMYRLPLISASASVHGTEIVTFWYRS